MKGVKMLRKIKKIATMGIAGVVAAGLSVGMIACSAQPTEQIAATVNDIKITEQKITDFVQNTRNSLGSSTDEAWATYLGQNNYTPEIIREQAIDYFVNNEALKLAAEDLGVTLDEALVEENFNATKAGYPTDQEWQDALKGAGLTEDTYKNSLRDQVLQTQVTKKYEETNLPPLEDAALFEAISAFDGARKSSHILVEDEAEANDVLAKVNSGEITFEDAATEYSTDTGSAAKGGDVGWDKLTSFVPEYSEGLAVLAKDEISGLVPSQFGFHIIKCTDLFEVPEGGLTSTEGVPTEIVDRATQDARAAEGGSGFQTWFSEFTDSLNVVINPMPEGLPYDVEPIIPEPEPAPEGEIAPEGTTEPTVEPVDGQQPTEQWPKN